MRHFIRRFIQRKILLGILAVFSLTLIGGALFIRSDAFLNWIKHRAEAEIRNRIEATYTVEIGKITGNVLTGVKLDNIAVFPTDGTPDEPILALQQLVLKYNLFALLRRKVEVTTLEISKPRLHAQVEAGGHFNLTQLFRLEDTPKSVGRGPVPRDASDNGVSSWTFAVQRVRCSDGTLRFSDRQRDLDITVTGVTLDFRGPLTTWHHQGTFSINNGTVAFNDAETAITAFDADFLIVASGGQLTQLRINVGNSVLDATGSYDEAMNWRANVDIQVDAADIQKFAMPPVRHIPSLRGKTPDPLNRFRGNMFRGIASLHITAEGTPDTVSGILTATVPHFTISGLSGHFTPTGGALNIRDVAVAADFSTHPVPTFALNRLQMHVAEGLFQASARMKIERNRLTRLPAFEGRWHAAGIQLAAIPPMQPFRNWEGSVTTTGTFSGKGTDISGLRLDSILEVTDTLLNGIPVADSRLTGTLVAPPLARVERLQGTGPRPAVKSAVSTRAYGRVSELNVIGTLAEANVYLGGFLGEDLRLHATSLRMDKLMAIFGGAPLNGLGEMNAKISTNGWEPRWTSGGSSNPPLSGSIEIPHTTFMDVPIGMLAGDFRYQDGQVFVENGLLTKGDSRVSIEGTVDMEGELPANFRVLAEPCQVAEYRQLLFGSAEYDVTGLVTGELICDGSLTRLDGRGTFDVTEGYAWGMRLDALKLPLAIEDYAITIADFQISAREQQVVLNLEMAASGDFDLDIRSRVPVQLVELVRAADVPDFPIDAAMDIVSIGTQREKQFNLGVDITLADITYQGNPLTDATLHGTLVEREKATGEPDIFQFVGEAFDGASQITGEISTATDSPYHFAVQSRAMPATPILRCLHPMLDAVTGTADSTVEITGTLAELSPKNSSKSASEREGQAITSKRKTSGVASQKRDERHALRTQRRVYPYDVDITVEATTLHYRGVPMTNPHPIRLHLIDDVWTFTDVALIIEERADRDIRNPGQKVTGTFSARDEVMDIKVTSAGVALEPVGTAFGIPIDGTARYEMSINGTVTAPRLALEVTVPELRVQTEFGGILLSTAGARVRYENNSVQIEPFVLQIHGNKIDVAGDIAVMPEDVNASRLNVNLRAPQLELANYEHFIRDVMPPGIDLFGASRGTGPRATVTEDVGVSRGTGPRATVTGDVGVSRGTGLRATVTGDVGVSRGTGPRATGAADAEGITGSLDVSVDVTGSLAEPLIAVQAGSAATNLSEIRIGKFPQPIVLDALQANVTLNRETMHIGDVDANWRIGDATYHAQGEASFPGSSEREGQVSAQRLEDRGLTPRFAFTVSANQLEVADFAVLFLKQAEPSIHGTLSAEVALTGTGISPDRISAVCEMRSLNLRIGTVDIASTAPLTFASVYGSLEGNFPALAIVSPLMETQLSVELGGTHAAPNITADWQGTFYHLGWRGTVDYRDEHITVHRMELASREGKTLTLTGGIPFDLALEAVPVAERFLEKPMAVRLRGNELPLAFFPRVAEVISEHEGVVDIDMRIVGTTRAPRLSGSVSVLAPHLRLRDFPEPIHNATLHLKAGEDGLDFTQFRFESGSGDCTGQHGYIGLDGLIPKEFAFTGLRIRRFPLGALARQAVPSEVLGEVRGHVTATLSEFRIPLDSFFTAAIPGVLFPRFSRVPSLTALVEVATASALIEDVDFAFNAEVTGSGEPIHYDFRNTEPVLLVLEGGSARLAQELLMKDFSYLHEAFGKDTARRDVPIFRIEGDFSAQLNAGILPSELQTRLQKRAPMETYTLTKREGLWRVAGVDASIGNGDAVWKNTPLSLPRETQKIWIWQRVPASVSSQKQPKGRMQIFEASLALGIDREASFGLKADFSRQLDAGTMPAALRSQLQSKGLMLPETLRVAKIDTLWQVQDEETKRRWTFVQENASLSVFEHSLQLSVDKGSEIQVAVCDVVGRVKNFDVSPLTMDWPMAYRVKGTLSASLHIGDTGGAPQITLRRKKPRTRTQLDGIHLNGVPIELNGRLRYREGAWEISKNRQLTTILGPDENTLTCSLRVETVLASLAFWEQLFQAPAHLLTGELTGELNVQAKDFGPLQFIVPTVSDASGDSELYAALSGTLDTPQIDGKVTFKNLALELEESGVSLREAEGEFKLSNSQLAITRFGGTLNGGYLSVTGDVFLWATDERLWNPAEPTLALEATLVEATFAQPGQYQVEIDSATFAFDGKLSSPLLTGSVDIRAGEYHQNWENVREWFTGTSVTEIEVVLDESPLRELQLDININVPSFYLLSSVVGPMDVHVACDGILTGLVQSPIFKGDVRILEGRMDFLKQFAVVEGSYIINESTTEFDPSMDIRLKTVNPLRAVPLRDGSTADLDVILTYQGKLSNPNFNLRAEPLNTSTTELPTQEELLALLSQPFVGVTFGGVTFGFEPYSRQLSVEYLMPGNMSLKFERDRHETYGVDFQFEGRF